MIITLLLVPGFNFPHPLEGRGLPTKNKGSHRRETRLHLCLILFDHWKGQLSPKMSSVTWECDCQALQLLIWVQVKSPSEVSVSFAVLRQLFVSELLKDKLRHTANVNSWFEQKSAGIAQCQTRSAYRSSLPNQGKDVQRRCWRRERDWLVLS